VLNFCPGLRGHGLALIAGAVLPLSLAPFDLWPLALLGLALFARLLQGLNSRDALARAFYFGLGYYGSGASWVFVSIHEFGNTALPLAVVMTALFVAAMALIFCLPWALISKIPSGERRIMVNSLGFAGLWMLGEWLRSWLFTGFPWLYVGYGHLQTPLAGWSPVVGVFGLGLIIAYSAAYLSNLGMAFRSKQAKPPLLTGALIVIALWGAGQGLRSQVWTAPKSSPISVGMVQPNIPQNLKWAPHFREPTLDRLRSLSESLWQKDWVIWPEAAVPMLYHEATDFLKEMDQRAQQEQSTLITGILYDDHQQRKYFNSVLGLGTGMGLYHKQRLVPFGEYVPMESFLRGLIAFFDLPQSVIHAGPREQLGLLAGDIRIAPSICYEVVYPGLVSEAAAQADVLLTISNDAWFGGSIGPLQHMQMAQMRALETGRYMIRSTNNGVSGIIDHQGNILAKSEQFTLQTLSGEVVPMSGLTPFLRWGSAPSLLLGALFVIVGLWRQRRETPGNRQAA